MFGSGKSLLLFALGVVSFVSVVAQQSIGFTIYPQQVLNGASYTVAWESNGQPVTIQLYRNGLLEDNLFTSDGTVSMFQWRVEDDYDGGTDYTLNLNTQGQVVAAPLWVIEDEDGLVVGGSTITAPAPTATITNPTGLSYPASEATPTAPTTTGTETALTTTTTGSSIPSATSSNLPVSDMGGLSGGAIAGIVIGVLLGIAIVAAVGWIWYRRKNAQVPRDDENGLKSFLALRGGGSHRIAHGTSPEFSEAPGNETFKSSASVEKSDAIGRNQQRDTMASDLSELHGASHTPWNELDGGAIPSAAGGISKLGNNSISPVMYELPAENVQRH